ncbi:RT11 protein, partial [Oreotrochilus melanogaster]|nr:RT11 protein [Oreotrochilus melanogaster]
ILQRSFLRWDGKVYEEIPIAHIKATYNNTIQCEQLDASCFNDTACLKQQFKISSRAAVVTSKRTNQLFFSQKARGKGVSHVRVMVKGLGPGRKVGV